MIDLEPPIRGIAQFEVFLCHGRRDATAKAGASALRATRSARAHGPACSTRFAVIDPGENLPAPRRVTARNRWALCPHRWFAHERVENAPSPIVPRRADTRLLRC